VEILASYMRHILTVPARALFYQFPSSTSDSKSEIEDAFDHVVLLALLTSEYTRVRERMNTDDGNLIWRLSNCTSAFRLREYETQGIIDGCRCGCVCVKRAVMSVMIEGC
jgi:hypothetical protein